jgi:hypothetical protein
MPDPIHSSGWTGDPPERPSTYGTDISSVSSEYQTLLRSQQELASLPPDLRALRRAAGFLFLSPLALWIAYFCIRTVIPDAFKQDYRGLLIVWSLLAMLAAACELTATSRKFIGLRRAFLATGIGTTIGGACLYGYAVTTSYAQALPSTRERTFEIYRCDRRCRFGGHFVHQRADGSTIEGQQVGASPAYGRSCTTVQQLSGDYGFSWVRVLERSPPAEHEVAWPIRREDCFSSKPLSSLKG